VKEKKEEKKEDLFSIQGSSLGINRGDGAVFSLCWKGRKGRGGGVVLLFLQRGRKTEKIRVCAYLEENNETLWDMGRKREGSCDLRNGEESLACGESYHILN